MTTDRELDSGRPPASAANVSAGDGWAGDVSAGDDLQIAGLLHDLGHQIMTVSILAESLHADATLPAEARIRAGLLVQESVRALDMMSEFVPARGRVPAPAATGGPVDVRELAEQVSRLSRLMSRTAIRLLPGRPTYVDVDSMTVWRVLHNLVDNAVRAAGPAGTVEIRIGRGAEAIVEVADSGGGFGNAPPGSAGLGLIVVTRLLAASGGKLEISSRRHGGTTARAVFGSRCNRTGPGIRDKDWAAA